MGCHKSNQRLPSWHEAANPTPSRACALRHRASVSNSQWSVKKPELLKHSLPPINQLLHDVTVWDEAAIAQRSDDLLARALKVWPRDV